MDSALKNASKLCIAFRLNLMCWEKTEARFRVSTDNFSENYISHSMNT